MRSRTTMAGLVQWIILIIIFILLLDPLIWTIFNGRSTLLLRFEPFYRVAIFIALPLYPHLSIGLAMYYVIFGLLFIGMIGFMFKIQKLIILLRKCMLPFWLLLASYYATAISASYSILKVSQKIRYEGVLIKWRGFPFQFFSQDCAMTDPCVHIEYIIADMALYFLLFWFFVRVYRWCTYKYSAH